MIGVSAVFILYHQIFFCLIIVKVQRIGIAVHQRAVHLKADRGRFDINVMSVVRSHIFRAGIAHTLHQFMYLF